MEPTFWRNKRVLVTGHTGFKGSWLTLWLDSLGAEVFGFAQEPPTKPSLYELSGISELATSTIGDIRNYEEVLKVVELSNPEIVIHMAAQPIVRTSYDEPLETYATNVMGTAHLLNALRNRSDVRAIVNITSDKCYRNNEWVWGYREDDEVGGNDPYSSSKACAEIVAAAMRKSFFNPANYVNRSLAGQDSSEHGSHKHSINEHSVALATVRAGNVVGGGDWAKDRLVPDTMQAFMNHDPVVVRNPISTRPWQHVLEPLNGYLGVAERLWHEGPEYGEAWNFGPQEGDAKPVEWIVNRLTNLWGEGVSWQLDESVQPHEDTFLKLDCSKAHRKLGWHPKLRIDDSLEWIVEWFKAYADGQNMAEVTKMQIARYAQL